MANLSLKTRRMLARGISRRTARLWGNRVFMGDGNRAQLTTAMTGANNDITFLAKTPRTPGNAVRVRIVVAGVSTALSVSVSGNDITINSATNASSVATSPAVDVIRAVNRDAAASLLVHAQRAPGNDGTGVVTALAFTNLAGAS
jgi:hypothetical protein